MVSLSVSVPAGLKHRMDEMDEINWSAVARSAFEVKLFEMERLKSIVSKSKLSEKDANELAILINKNMGRQFKRVIEDSK